MTRSKNLAHFSTATVFIPLWRQLIPACMACVVLIFFCCGMAAGRSCGTFYLRNSDGEIINPLAGKNDDQPFSTRKTCGACHAYEEITRGYHFQQGWDNISDTFDPAAPWILSDGMMGKH